MAKTYRTVTMSGSGIRPAMFHGIRHTCNELRIHRLSVQPYDSCNTAHMGEE